jgi:NAD(P)-dependent dehydrogenase (short-subunit alcohol dehydrogenase family)
VADIVATGARLNVLVNNGGIFPVQSLMETSLDDYRRVIETNQVGVFLGMKAVVPAMRDASAGSIINISSIAGMTATPGAFGYGASKWAVRGMTKAAAHDLGRDDIRVNSIHPGVIETPMIHNLPQYDADPELIIERIPWDVRASRRTSPSWRSSWPPTTPATSPPASASSTSPS